MKVPYQWLACLLLAVILVSCSIESDGPVDGASLIVSDIDNSKNQIPNPMYDGSVQGIYHGVVASASTQSRGKIWVDVGNNSNFNALVELVDGSSVSFNLNPENVTETAAMTVFEFTSIHGSFTLDLGEPSSPEISNIVLFNESFYGRVVKSRSSNPPSSTTASFTEIGNPSFSGTWNLIADGSISNPNGNNGDGVTSILITINGDLIEDFDIENFDAQTCLGSANYIPTLNSFGMNDYTISDVQNTPFAGGTSKWYLSYDAFTGVYMNYTTCETTSGGTFTWTSSDGTISKMGEIMLD